MMAIGALMLAALPPFTTFMGKSLLEEGASAVGYNWLIVLFIFVSAMTGGAVLRVTGRVFLGWGQPKARIRTRPRPPERSPKKRPVSPAARRR
jgi:multicomponent Na+:H+ antiporter subunit D